MKYHNKEWQDARIHQYENLPLSPASKVLHYCQTVWEGMKAYRREKDDKILLFRPEKNFERLNKSAERMAMPQIDKEFAYEALKKLLILEKDWIPRARGTSVYIRPTLIATDNNLGVKVSKDYLFFIILSPVGPYYKNGYKPIKIYVSEEYVRAVKGGTGEAKTGGNYAAGMYATEIAHQNGCDQVLWLDGVERKYAEEAGAMNIFFRFKDKVITPPAEGTILKGITRDSVIQLIKKYNMPISEEKISIDKIIKGAESGDLLEVFLTGTAVIITSFGEIYYNKKNYTVNNNKVGELTKRLYDNVCDYHYGIIEDDMNWVKVVD